MCDRNLTNLSALIILNVILKSQGSLSPEEAINHSQLVQELSEIDKTFRDQGYNFNNQVLFQEKALHP